MESILDAAVKNVIRFVDFCHEDPALSILVAVLASGWMLFLGAYAQHKLDGKPDSIKSFARLTIKTVFSRETYKF